jgi:hypothetical protein
MFTILVLLPLFYKHLWSSAPYFKICLATLSQIPSRYKGLDFGTGFSSVVCYKILFCGTLNELSILHLFFNTINVVNEWLSLVSLPSILIAFFRTGRSDLQLDRAHCYIPNRKKNKDLEKQVKEIGRRTSGLPGCFKRAAASLLQIRTGMELYLKDQNLFSAQKYYRWKFHFTHSLRYSVRGLHYTGKSCLSAHPSHLPT